MNKIISYLFLRIDALKGQQIIAQGFDVSVRLSSRRSLSRTAAPWVYGRTEKSSALPEAGGAMTFIKVKFMSRTKMMVLYFPKMRFFNSLPAAGWRPKGIICFVHRIPPACGRQGGRFFPLHPFPRLRRELSRTATFWFVPPETMPWAELFRPFRPGLVYKE